MFIIIVICIIMMTCVRKLQLLGAPPPPPHPATPPNPPLSKLCPFYNSTHPFGPLPNPPSRTPHPELPTPFYLCSCLVTCSFSPSSLPIPFTLHPPKPPSFETALLIDFFSTDKKEGIAERCGERSRSLVCLILSENPRRSTIQAARKRKRAASCLKNGDEVLA